MSTGPCFNWDERFTELEKRVAAAELQAARVRDDTNMDRAVLNAAFRAQGHHSTAITALRGQVESLMVAQAKASLAGDFPECARGLRLETITDIVKRTGSWPPPPGVYLVKYERPE